MDKLFDKVIQDNVTVASVYHTPQTIEFMKELLEISQKTQLNQLFHFTKTKTLKLKKKSKEKHKERKQAKILRERFIL